MSHPQQTRSLAASINELNYRSDIVGTDPISMAIKDALQKVGAKPYGDPQNPQYIADPVASIVDFSITREKLALPSVGGNVIQDMYLENSELRKEIAKASTYLRSGCALAVIPDPFKDNNSGNPGADLGKRAFATVTPLAFSVIQEGGELTPVASPLKFVEHSFADAGSYGVEFKVPRNVMKHTPFAALNGLIYSSLLSGIGLAIDKAIAAKIAESTPETFTLAKAAAAAVKTAEIRGVTDGTSTKAAMDAGNLYLNGFSAELAEAPGNYLIIPKTYAVAIPELLRLIVKKELDGGWSFTLWTDIEALSTSDSLAWTVE